ncbi:hypothetical protein BASA61_004594 [Batrachochytrium salamandrivorans]|nr:hypothetical protein BASA61_004594 [Batrachochytrium salamandrivorans]
MKLAIASTTILFAMMAAQAAVLSVAPATDVNLVKRTPNGDGDDEQSDMAGQSSSDPTSQFPMAGQSSSDPTPQDSMDDQSSSGPTPQLPLTKDEEDQVKNLHELLYSELSELAREAGTKQKKLLNWKSVSANSKRNVIGKPHLHAPTLILRLLNSRKSSLTLMPN